MWDKIRKNSESKIRFASFFRKLKKEKNPLLAVRGSDFASQNKEEKRIEDSLCKFPSETKKGERI